MIRKNDKKNECKNIVFQTFRDNIITPIRGVCPKGVIFTGFKFIRDLIS